MEKEKKINFKIVLFIIVGILIVFICLRKGDSLGAEKILIKSSNIYASYGISGLMNYKEYGTVICENGNIYEFETQDKEYAEYQGYAKKELKELNNLFWNGLSKCEKIGTISSGDLKKLKEYLKGTTDDYTSKELEDNTAKNKNSITITKTDSAKGTSKELEFYNYDIEKNITIIQTSDDFIRENNTSNIEDILKIVNETLNTNYESMK